MSSITISSSTVGNSLSQLLMCEDMVPGTDLSYQTAKAIYLWHPVGAKMADSPVKMAQSQAREIAIPASPEDRVRKAFVDQWAADGADKTIANVAKTARIYGLASVALLIDGVDNDAPLDASKLAGSSISFNVLDPLNTAGSLVLSQNPNALDFQKSHTITISGKPVHHSRSRTLMNEEPVYIAYSTSAFGYVGRSVYQRALYPLKSFVQTMIADDMVARKVGVLVAKMKPAGSIVDNIMGMMAGLKRNLLQEAATNNVLSISNEEAIESLNLQNLDAPHALVRKNILENIAAAADMPAKLLLQETFAEGFGEGTEDAKYVAGYVDGIRAWMKPLYDFFDEIVQHRAWNEEFYNTIKEQFPEEYGSKPYKQAFYEWKNAFTADWPSLLREPDSEKIKVEEAKFKAIVALIEVFFPNLDPENKALMIQWAQDNFNEHKLLFSTPLNLDIDALKNFTPPQMEAPAEMPHEPKPFSASDSAGGLVTKLRSLPKVTI